MALNAGGSTDVMVDCDLGGVWTFDRASILVPVVLLLGTELLAECLMDCVTCGGVIEVILSKTVKPVGKMGDADPAGVMPVA